jgi:hypothetical protein
MDELVLTIDRLRLTFANAAGHEHRVRAISARAAALMRELANQRLLEAGIDLEGLSTERIQAAPIEIDLRLTAEEQAARRIAMAALNALLLQLGIQE